MGCSARPTKPEKTKKYTHQKVFYYNFDAVWRAAQLTLKYPIAVNNMDNGVLETDWIRGADGFVAPTATEPSSGLKYKIIMNIVKGKTEGRPSVKVTIVKRMERQRDFFSESEVLESDSLEEKVLMYRIEREILIDEALKKASGQNS
ncbi:MAG: hypothetical protein BroJett040_25120 [Oligoflexia bacterium]|nr:MAG: hypothetical protein BroJett040_25120 [Oligoflexia bacterium]